MKKSLWLLGSMGVIVLSLTTAGITAFALKPSVVEVVKEPPPGWNPLTATDEELNAYNYPPRPKDAAQEREWERIVTTGKWEKSQFHSSGIHGNLYKAVE